MMTQRRALAAFGTRSERPTDMTVVGVGVEQIRRRLPGFTDGAREVLEVFPAADRGSLEPNRERDRRDFEDGVRWRAVYDAEGCDSGAVEILAEDSDLPHYWGAAQIQTKILDRKLVILEGPIVEGQRTAIACAHHATLRAAWEYWTTVWRDSAAIAGVLCSNPLTSLSRRQRELAYLMADGHSDQVVAERLGVSLRTVRYEVSRLSRLVGARSRFGLGVRLGHLGFGHLDP